MADSRLKRAALVAELRRVQERRRRRWWWALLLLLLPAARWCSCGSEPEPPVEVVEGSDPGDPGRASGPAAPTSVPVAGAALPTRPRPAFVIPSPPATPWVDALRVQVAARGPRLAACFEGVARPGVLRWTAAVNPADGAVSESALDVGTVGAALTAAQRACVLAVLADPPFRLDAASAPSTPVRVAMVLEF